MSKKILSVMLALVMVMSVFSVVSFAAVHVEYEKGADIKDETGTVVDQEPVEQTQYWSLETDNVADANGKYTVNVVLETNYAVGAISFAIVAEGATLEKAVEGAALTAAAGFNADVRLDKVKNIVYIVPDPAEEGTEAPVLAAGSVVAKLTFSLTAESATVALMNDARLVNNAGTLIAARPADGLLACDTLVYGQRVIDENGDDVELDAELASVTLGEEAAEPVELVIADGSGVILNTAVTCNGAYNGALMGFAGTAFNNKNYFDASLSASNGGSLKYVVSPGAGRNRYGTGATVQLIDADGITVLATYAVIIFGDANGDGVIESKDMGIIASHVSVPSLATGTLEYYAASGADVSVRSIGIAMTDRTSIAKHADGRATIDQAKVATKYTSVSC